MDVLRVDTPDGEVGKIEVSGRSVEPQLMLFPRAEFINKATALGDFPAEPGNFYDSLVNVVLAGPFDFVSGAIEIVERPGGLASW